MCPPGTSVCRGQWGSTAGRVVACLLLCVAMVASELIGARAVCGRTAWECARHDGGPMHCVWVCVCVEVFFSLCLFFLCICFVFLFVLSFCFFFFFFFRLLLFFFFFQFFSGFPLLGGFFPSFSRCHIAGSRVLRSSISLLFSVRVSWLSETVLAADFALFLLSLFHKRVVEPCLPYQRQHQHQRLPQHQYHDSHEPQPRCLSSLRKHFHCMLFR